MNREIRKDILLNEECHYFRHKSGLNVFVIEKDLSTLSAIFLTNYGSIDSIFKLSNEADFSPVPDGVAHFLEHKLFEESDGSDAFNRFAVFGGDSNADTGFDRTRYYFSATENYRENLEILLDFVTHPYFNAPSVQKEQGIIGQEIRMYEDDPNWRVFLGILQAMYEANPVRIDIAGTTDTIAKITPEVLFRCYNTFYNLYNMALVVCGRLKAEEVEEICNKQLEIKPRTEFERPTVNEADKIYKKIVREQLEVAQPLFCIGFKDKPEQDSVKSVKKDIAHSIILKAIFGSSSEFYYKNYESGLITKKFGASYSSVRNACFAIIEGSAKDPDAVYRAVIDEIEEKRKQFVSVADFERIRKTFYSSALQSYDSTENIADIFASYAFIGVHPFDIPELVLSLTYEEARQYFIELYSQESSALSIIEPIKGKNK